MQREKNEKTIAGAKMAAEAAKEERRMVAAELLATNAGRIADSTAALERHSAIALEILQSHFTVIVSCLLSAGDSLLSLPLFFSSLGTNLITLHCGITPLMEVNCRVAMPSLMLDLLLLL